MAIHPFVALADINALSAIQSKMETVKQKATEVQEKIQNVKNELQNTLTQAKGMAGDIQNSVQNVKKGMIPDIKTSIPSGIGKIDVKGNATQADKAVEENYIKTQGEGNDVENFKQAQEEMQEILREVASELYAIAFTTRSNMIKEEPSDKDMQSTDQILQEANVKAMSCVKRLAVIYALESAIQNFQMIEETQNVIIDASQQEDGEK